MVVIKLLQDEAAKTHKPNVIYPLLCGVLCFPLRYGPKYKETILEVIERILNSVLFD